jgi:hypothetical protein
MKLGDFLNTMAAKTGLQNDPTFVAFLQANPQLAGMELDDKVAVPMNTGLMSLDGAKNNTDVKKHFDALVLNAIDSKLNPLAAEYGATADFEAEKSTYKRIDILTQKIAAKIAEIKGSSADASKDAEVKRLTGELQKMQQQLTTLTTDKDNEIANIKTAHAKEMLSTLIDINLSGKSYANKAVDAKTNLTIAKAILDAKLTERGALVVNEGGQLKLKNATAPELDFLDEGNKPMDFAQFTDKVLADAKLLEVSNGGGGSQHRTIIQQPGVGAVDMTAFNAASNAALSGIGG